MYFSVYDIQEYETIKSAPPKETLKLFGGPLSIEDFRDSSNNYSKDFRLIVSPMTSIVPLIEENNREKNKCHYTTNKNRIFAQIIDCSTYINIIIVGFFYFFF